MISLYRETPFFARNHRHEPAPAPSAAPCPALCQLCPTHGGPGCAARGHRPGLPHPGTEALAPLLEQARLPQDRELASQALALRIAGTLRQRKSSAGRAGIVQGLLQEFALSSHEGVALMCLAEALLRIPDKATRDALIRDKISSGQWEPHLGKSPRCSSTPPPGACCSPASWSPRTAKAISASLGRLIGKGGEPLIRKGVDMAMRMMGEQFVTGETIGEALVNARTMEREGFRYSYDMLGEAALTSEDAQRYYASYEQAIHAIGKASNGRGIYEGPGISIKLSALHPRYSRAQWDRVMHELYPQVLRLTELARQYDIGLNIDAEEADRLDISLDLLERLCHAPSLQGWNGIGFVIQAYQKRCPHVIDFVIDLARHTQRRLMVRLVKGAYWDSEIKRAQVDGLDDYPVYTRKAHTDVSYLACARKLLAAPRPSTRSSPHTTHRPWLPSTTWPGTTTTPGSTEFQCLHGMGEPLYEQVVGAVTAGKLGRPAASMPRWARTKPCWPTWCAACWKTAPTPRLSTALPMRPSRWRNWCAIPSPRCSKPPPRKARRPAPPAYPAAAAALRRQPPKLPGWTCPANTNSPAWPRPCTTVPGSPGWLAPAGHAAAHLCRAGAQSGRPPRRGGPGAGGHRKRRGPGRGLGP